MAANQSGKSIPQKAVDALMALLAEKEWGAISLSDVATKAGITLADLRGAFPSKGAILAGFTRNIDQSVLTSSAAETGLADQPARERIFDVMMRRFDALKPYKAAIRNARKGLLSDPFAASAWNKIEVNSAQWMLAAAGIRESGPQAALRAQGLAVIFARVLSTWLDDDDPDMPKTMRELDRMLRQAEHVVETTDMMKKACRPVFSLAGRLLGKRRGPPEAGADDAASAI